MKRSIIAVIVGGLIAFVWGFLSWTVFPWHQPVPFENESEVATFLKQQVSSHNVYAYPAWDHSKEYDHLAKTKAGPYVYATIRPQGAEPSMAVHMTVGILTNMLAAAVLVFMIQNSRQHTFPGRLSIALLAGLFLGVMTAGPPWNWLGLPGTHAFAFLCDGIIPWTLAGAAIAKILPTPSAGA